MRTNKGKYKLIVILLLIILIFSIALFTTIGTAKVSVLDIFKIVASKIPMMNEHVDLSNIADSSETIIWNLRLPRVLLGAIIGANLSIAGVAFQGMFKNPMADPYVLGISSGAALGAALAIVFKIDIDILNISSITIFAFLGALLAVFTVYNIARVKNKIPVTTLLLAGVAVGQFLTAIMSFTMILSERDMVKITYWTLGSLSGKGWEPVLGIALPSLVCIILISFFARDLNILLTGEESAQSLGVDVEKTKTYILLLGAFITAISVAVSGIIGFVGLIIPHIVRLVIGPDHRILLPAAALTGSIFMIIADTLARTLISPMEIPVGIITALFGGPFFIYLLRSKKKNI
ncbi:MAG TPA: iron chelate uptake ABC transporter family permease subunit [Tissierellaceae bacterium]|nr:iron chelate uptake ABC transporter family permease subunit [Tissierellaceae bacterium]